MIPHASESSDMWCKREYINILHRVRICFNYGQIDWDCFACLLGNIQNIRVHGSGAGDIISRQHLHTNAMMVLGNGKFSVGTRSCSTGPFIISYSTIPSRTALRMPHNVSVGRSCMGHVCVLGRTDNNTWG